MALFDKIGFDSIKKWFQGKPTLKQISLDDLRREQVSVETELNKLLDENEKIENDDLQLKEEYKAAHAAGRSSMKRVIAQKLQSLQLKRKGLETRLAYAQKMFQTVTGLTSIKENMRFFENLGVGSVLAQMDIAELERFVLDATVEGTLQQDKLAAALRGITEGVDALNVSSQDSGVDDFMNELDAELLGKTETTSLAAHSEQLDDILKNIDSVAEKGLTASRKIQQTNRQDEEQVQ